MAALMLIVAIIAVWIGYRAYSTRMDRYVLQADPNRATPAKLYQDGVDFINRSIK